MASDGLTIPSEATAADLKASVTASIREHVTGQLRALERQRDEALRHATNRLHPIHFVRDQLDETARHSMQLLEQSKSQLDSNLAEAFQDL